MPGVSTPKIAQIKVTPTKVVSIKTPNVKMTAPKVGINIKMGTPRANKIVWKK